jgi:hypothetical protein
MNKTDYQREYMRSYRAAIRKRQAIQHEQDVAEFNRFLNRTEFLESEVQRLNHSLEVALSK